MNLRSVYFQKSLLRTLAVLCFVSIPAASWAQSLTGSASPASGGAGVSYSTLTGSGFPAGAITGATVHFGSTCAVPQTVSGPVTQVTSQATIRRFQFLIPATLAPGSYKVWVTGTAGTTAFNTLNTNSCSAITVSGFIRGTAAVGTAISGGAVTIIDSTGAVKTGTTASDGTYSVDNTGLVPPYLVRVITSTTVGNFPAGTTLYSVSADANASTNINVHQLSDLIVRSYYSAQGINPDTAFASPTAGNAAPGLIAEQAISFLVLEATQLWQDKFGISGTPGPPTNGQVNLISSPFVAYQPGGTPTGLDAILDAITSESVNANGAITGITLANGTITEAITPLFPGGASIVINTTTTNSANNFTSSESFTGQAFTSAQQPIVDGINASLAIFANIINTKGAALMGSDLLPTYAPDYLNEGNTASQDANNFASENAGILVNSLTVFSFNHLDTVNNIADVNIAYDVNQGGQHEIGQNFEIIFKNEGGTWLQYGDQRIGNINAHSESRTSEGADTISIRVPGTYFQTDVFTGVTTSTAFGVTNVTVTSPQAGNIWNGAAVGTLFHGPTSVQHGQTFDQFYLLSQALGPVPPFPIAPPPAGTPFTFTLTTPSSGTPSYTVNSNAVTNERTVIFANTAAGNGPLSSVVGKTLTYTWTLPTTYSIGHVNLFAQVFDGPSNTPATHECNVNSTTSLGSTSTSGSITIPANMSFCGYGAIQQVNLFVEVDGKNGETNIVVLSYPY